MPASNRAGATHPGAPRTSVSGLHANLEVALVGEKLVIGRSAECDVSIPDRRVSGRHAVVYRSGDTFVIRDLKSRNGTFVNGERVEEHALCPEDEIVVGETRLRIQAPRPETRLAESIKIQIPLTELENEASPSQSQSVEPASDLAERLSLLHRMIAALAEDREELVTRGLARLALRLVGADEVTIYAVEDGELVPGARHTESELPTRDATVPDAMLGEALRRKRPVLQKTQNPGADGGPGCSVSFPLRSGEEVVSVLHLRRAGSRAFSEADLHVLALLCNHAAALIARARERETLREVCRDLEGIQGFLQVVERAVAGAAVGDRALSSLRLASRVAGRCVTRIQADLSGKRGAAS